MVWKMMLNQSTVVYHHLEISADLTQISVALIINRDLDANTAVIQGLGLSVHIAYVVESYISVNCGNFTTFFV